MWCFILGSYGIVTSSSSLGVRGLIYLFKVYPMGYGQGSAGINGTGFQLLIIIFMLLFGVTLGQMVAALSPSVQVSYIPSTPWYLCLINGVLGRSPLQSLYWSCPSNVLWCYTALSDNDQVLEVLVVSIGPLYSHVGRYGVHRVTVINFFVFNASPGWQFLIVVSS